MKEEWRQIENYEGRYEISNAGRVKRVMGGVGAVAGRILSPWKDRLGYYAVSLYKNNGGTFKLVHRLVAMAFIGPVPTGMEVNHIDCDASNNSIENLEYVTHAENVLHAYRIGLIDSKGDKSRNRILTEADIPQIRRMANEGKLTLKEIGDIYGVCKSTIYKIKRGINWASVK